MVKKSKRQTKSNPIAKDLRTTKYKQRFVTSKKIYHRSKKIIIKNLPEEN